MPAPIITQRERFFLIVDKDRSEQGDWTIEELRREAAGHNITLCVQNPNHEGLLLRIGGIRSCVDKPKGTATNGHPNAQPRQSGKTV
jgi:hypothetical protein